MTNPANFGGPDDGAWARNDWPNSAYDVDGAIAPETARWPGGTDRTNPTDRAGRSAHSSRLVAFAVRQLDRLAAADLASRVPLLVLIPAVLFTVFRHNTAIGVIVGFGAVGAVALFQLVRGQRAGRYWFAQPAGWVVTAVLVAVLLSL